jgi:hypothetical protein
MRRRRGAIESPAQDAPTLFDVPAIPAVVAAPTPRAVSSSSDLHAYDTAIPEIYAEVGESFPGASPGSAIAVSTLTQTVKDVVEGAFIPLWVRGEIAVEVRRVVARPTRYPRRAR